MTVGYRKLLQYRYIRFFGRTLTLVPSIVAVFLLGMLGGSWQVQEVYLTIIEGDWLRGLAGLAGVVLLCLLLYAWHREFATWSMDKDYPDHADPGFDALLCRTRDIKAIALAVLPCVGMVLGLWGTVRRVYGVETAEGVVGLLRRDADPDFAKYVNASLKAPDPLLAHLTLLAGVLVLAGLIAFLVVAISRDWTLQRLMRVSALAAALVLAIAWTLPERYVVAGAGWVGSLAVFCVAAATLIALLWLVTLGSRSGVPLMALGALGIVILVGLKVYAQSGGERAADSRSHGLVWRAPPGGDDDRALLDTFRTWLDSRKSALAATSGNVGERRIPVFIFALQGGGIYAASAGATLLARLEDRCPGFSRHVFAVSGVSGGAVGSMVFNAIMASRTAVTPPAPQAASAAPCAALLDAGEGLATSVSNRVHRTIRSDHLSAVSAYVFPDLLGKLLGGTGTGRSRALEESLVEALRRVDGASATAASSAFGKHWTVKSGFPAPVLNSTWVETGFRVAFAPFPLKPAGDGTLYSFADAVFAGARPGTDRINDRVSLVEAAVVSARFPGAMAAWQLQKHPFELVQRDLKTAPQIHERTWNFVDGGYADGSGVATALAIFNRLKRFSTATSVPLPVDLRLVVLTETPPELELSTVQNGTNFSDIVAPISALMNVRSLLASRAVTSAALELAGDDRISLAELPAAITSRSERQSSMLVVRINRDDFPLTLGWTISDLSNSTIGLMLGDAGLCRSREQAETSAKDTILANSCVQREILSMLGAMHPLTGPQP